MLKIVRMNQIILASKSPRRKQLLEWANIPFTVITADTTETYPSHLPVQEIPIYIARDKAKAVHATPQLQQQNQAIIIAADTVVVLENEIIGKPANRDEAITTLTKLSGNTHRVITGVVITQNKMETTAFADITWVHFYPLTQEEISFYVDTYQPYDKAGAYAIQEWIGVVGIKKIEGDFYNVMGLPISRVVQALNKLRSIIR
jgi:septum formation protein